MPVGYCALRGLGPFSAVGGDLKPWSILDCPEKIMRLVRLIFFLGLFVMGTPVQAESSDSSFCSTQERIIFSCQIAESTKTVSVCLQPAVMTENKQPMIHYRFGKLGQSPELEYPEKQVPMKEAFNFNTRITSGFPFEVIGFERGNTGYDVIMRGPSGGDEWGEFSGVAVTLNNRLTKLIPCALNSAQVNFAPIKELLGIDNAGHFSDSIPRIKSKKSPYKISKNETTEPSGYKISTSFPLISDAAIDREIKKFIESCNLEDEFPHGAGSECSRDVFAGVIDEKYLVITFSASNYGFGAAHPSGWGRSNVYLKQEGAWKLIKPSELFVNSATCRRFIGGNIYRQLKPLLLADLGEFNEQSLDEFPPESLIDMADIYPTDRGVEFAGFYSLGTYASRPTPVLLTWKQLGKCLAKK
jgi:hypothetical protein